MHLSPTSKLGYLSFKIAFDKLYYLHHNNMIYCKIIYLEIQISLYQYLHHLCKINISKSTTYLRFLDFNQHYFELYPASDLLIVYFDFAGNSIT